MDAGATRPFQDFSWGDAVRYDDYARRGARYRIGVRGILGMAGDLTGLRVADVAAGTGLLTADLVERVGPTGHVLAVDRSEAMLRVARVRIDDPRVTFACCAAEDLGDVAPVPVDVVLCNAAFWLFDRSRTLAAFRQVLKPAGAAIFNFSERVLPITGPGSGEGRELRRRNVLDECLRRARVRYRERAFPTVSTTRTSSIPQLRAGLEASGDFSVEALEVTRYAVSRDDELQWLQAGAWGGHPLGALAAAERNGIIREVFAEIPATAVFSAQWVTVRARVAS